MNKEEIDSCSGKRVKHVSCVGQKQNITVIDCLDVCEQTKHLITLSTSKYEMDIKFEKTDIVRTLEQKQHSYFP